MVTITVNGKGEMKSSKDSPECMAEDDHEMLEDLIVAAYNDAKTKLIEKCGKKCKKLRVD